MTSCIWLIWVRTCHESRSEAVHIIQAGRGGGWVIAIQLFMLYLCINHSHGNYIAIGFWDAPGAYTLVKTTVYYFLSCVPGCTKVYVRVVPRHDSKQNGVRWLCVPWFGVCQRSPRIWLAAHQEAYPLRDGDLETCLLPSRRVSPGCCRDRNPSVALLPHRCGELPSL